MCHPLRPRFRDRGRFSTQAADRGGAGTAPARSRSRPPLLTGRPVPRSWWEMRGELMLTWRNFQQEFACSLQPGRKASPLHPAAPLQAALHHEEVVAAPQCHPQLPWGQGCGAETLRGRSTARAAPGLPFFSASSDLNSPSTQGYGVSKGGHGEPQQQRLGEHGGWILRLPPSPAAPRGPAEPEAAPESSLSSARPLLMNHLHPARSPTAALCC